MKKYIVAVLLVLTSNVAWGQGWVDCYKDLEASRKSDSPVPAALIFKAEDLSLKLQDTFQRIEADRLTSYQCTSRFAVADNNPYCVNLDRRMVWLSDQYLEGRRQFDQTMQQAGLVRSDREACGYSMPK